VALRVGENPMSAETWSADSIVMGQNCRVNADRHV